MERFSKKHMEDDEVRAALVKEDGMTPVDAKNLVAEVRAEINEARAISFARKVGDIGEITDEKLAESMVRSGLVKNKKDALALVLKSKDDTELSRYEKILNVAGLFKTTFSAGDISGVGRQARAFIAHPIIFAREAKENVLLALGKSKTGLLDRQMAFYEALVREGWDEAGFHFRSMGSAQRGGDEAFPSGDAVVKAVQEKFGTPGKVWGKIVNNTNEGYVSMLNSVGGQVLLDQSAAYKAIGVPLTRLQKRQLADVTNHSLGRLTNASDASPLAARAAMTTLNAVFFSPQLRGARWTFLYKDVPSAVTRLTAKLPEVAKFAASGSAHPFVAAGVRPADIETLRLASGLVISTAALYALMWKAVGVENVELDMSSTNFGRAELGKYGLGPALATFVGDSLGVGTQQYGGKTYMDLTNGYGQEMRLVYRLITGQNKGVSGEKSQLEWQAENQYKNSKFKLLGTYLMNMTSPSGRAALNVTGFASDDLADIGQNPLLSSMMFGVIGNTIASSGWEYPGREKEKVSGASAAPTKPRMVAPGEALVPIGQKSGGTTTTGAPPPASSGGRTPRQLGAAGR